MKQYLIITFLYICLFFTGCAQKKYLIPRGFSRITLPTTLDENKIILICSGLINQEKPVVLDLVTLMAFPKSSFTSIDPWDSNTHTFTGVAIFPLLQRIGLDPSATKIDVIALNDYKVTIGIEDISQYEYILAYKVDSEVLQTSHNLKNRSPLSVAINFSKFKDLDVEMYKFHLAWQIKEIIIR